MPRQGLAIDISTLAGSGGAVTTIDDFVFESFTAGQMHPIRTASRTNLLTYSEDFSQSIYSRVRSTLTPNDIVSPNGSTNGSKIEADVTGNSGSWINALVTSYSGGHTISVFAKKGTTEFLLITEVYPNGAVFNLDNGTVKQVSSGNTASISDEGNGWFRCSYSFNTASATKAFFIVGNSNTSITLHSATDGNNLYLFGAQLEQDILATAYIPTSGSTVTVATILNDTSNVWDFDGTDIMIEEDPESEGFWEEGYPEGATLPELVLNGDYADLGSELTPASDFASDFSTIHSSTISQSNGTITFNNATSSGSQTQLINRSYSHDPTPKTYKVQFTISNHSQGTFRISLGNNLTTSVDADGDYTFHVLHDAGLPRNFFYVSNSTLTVSNISVIEADPNDRWTLGDGWSIEDGKAVSAGDSTNSSLTQTLSLPAGQYEVYFDAIVTAGSFSIQAQGSGTDTGSVITSSGPHTEIFTTTANRSTFSIRSNDGNGVGSVDNVSVKEYAVQPLDI